MKRILRLLKQAIRHSGLLLKVLGLLLIIRTMLSTFRFTRTQTILANTSRQKRGSSLALDAPEVRRLRWAVRAVAKRLFGDKPCLPQALGLQWLLKRRGIQTELHIGVKKDEQKRLEAHAWIEHEGRILIGGVSSRTSYTPLDPSVLNSIR